MSEFQTDHYATLGLDRRCTEAQLRAAYRRLSKAHHPDLHGGSEASVRRTQEINEAHEVLSDPVRRRVYDRELAAESGSGGGENGAGVGRVGKREGKIEKNVVQEAQLRIEELIRGVRLKVEIRDPGNPRGAESYDLEIPAGTAVGARFRLARGEPFVGGRVEVRVKVRASGRFKVKGTDLRCDLRIDGRRATQGGVETVMGALGGALRVVIPAGVGRGEVIRVVGEGLPKARGGRGDLLVRVEYRVEGRVVR